MMFLNVDLLFKNCLTERLIQISIIFCNFVRKAAALLIVTDYFSF